MAVQPVGNYRSSTLTGVNLIVFCCMLISASARGFLWVKIKSIHVHVAMSRADVYPGRTIPPPPPPPPPPSRSHRPLRLHEPPNAAPKLPSAATPGPLLGGYSPLRADLFKGALEDHPDRRYSDYITNGLAEGFRVGFDRRQQLRSATHNLPSVSEHDSVVSSYINTELSANRLLGPLPSRIARYTHRSRIGVVPKGHNTGKWRLITDLSFPLVSA